MGSCYRTVCFYGEATTPGESMSFLEYLLGEERWVIEELSQRPFEEQWEDLKDKVALDGLTSALFEEGFYYPLLFVTYKIV